MQSNDTGRKNKTTPESRAAELFELPDCEENSIAADVAMHQAKRRGSGQASGWASCKYSMANDS